MAIHAKLKYTTLIVVPLTEKIMEAATGDKDFWVVDVVGSFCFVHPAKQGISSNLNLITDKGKIYSCTLQRRVCPEWIVIHRANLAPEEIGEHEGMPVTAVRSQHHGCSFGDTQD